MDRAAARRARRARALDPADPERRRFGSVRAPCLGIDVGGVIVDLVGHDSDTSFFGSRPLDTPAVPDAFATIAALAHDSFDGRAVIISKAGPRVSARTLEWLRHHRFHEVTGIAPVDVHFVRARSDKAEVCRRLGVTHFIDDRLDVLQALTTVSHRYFFVGGLGSQTRPLTDVPAGITRRDTWPQLAASIRASLPR
jgi:hypothetical protein